MADDIDIANERAALRLKKQLEVRKPTGPAATGYCLNCDSPMESDISERRWCDQECRDDWQKREDRRLQKELRQGQ